MDKNTLLGFNTDYEADSGENYLVLYKDGLTRNKLVDYQVEMITNNSIPGILYLDVREKNMEVKLYYKLNNLASLTNYLKRQKISKNEFISILDKVVSVIMELDNYFLDDKSVILNEDFIYIDPRSKEVFFLYIPAEIQQNVTSSFRNFVVDLLINSAKIDTEDDFVQRLLELLKSEGFILRDFTREMKTLINDTGEWDFEQGQSPMAEMPKLKLPDREQPYLRESTLRDSTYKSINLDSQSEKESLVVRKEIGKKLNARTAVLGGLAGVSVLGAIFSSLKDGLNEIDVQIIDFSPLYLGLLAVIAGITVGLYYFKKRGILKGIFNKKEDNNPVTNISNAEQPMLSTDFNTNDNVLIKENLFEGNYIGNNPVQNYDIYNSDDTTILVKDSNRATVLGEKKLPVLSAVNGNDNLVINRNILLVGRNQEFCDYVIENKSIGRAHAEIRNTNGSYFVIDLDSRNGTYINDKKLISNKQYELNENDKIKFADTEYTFCYN